MGDRQRAREKMERDLDQQLEDSFPASDPPTLTPPAGDILDCHWPDCEPPSTERTRRRGGLPTCSDQRW